MSEQRKLVTVLFADVVGSTALASDRDPEVVRALMGRYFARMRAIAEEHGGTVEKFAGDAVMVVFGVPRVHDDDAERAVRAALAMAGAVAELNASLPVALELRIGVNSGEVVASAGEDRQFMVSGDAVNVAARLQQAARPGEVLVGELAHRMTAAAFEYATARFVEAKGKAEPLSAFVVTRALASRPEQQRGLPGLWAPLIGRDRELRMLLETFGRVLEEETPHVFTIAGGPGVGKSRLVAEALDRLVETGAVVRRGRCLPYGSGITWWAFAEVVRQDAGIHLDDDRAVALAKLDARLQELGGSNWAPIRARLAVILGLEEPGTALADVDAERVAAELAWGVRQHMQRLAGNAGLVLVLDDLQWADEALLNAVEQIAARTDEGPLMLVCVARPELIERRPGWGGGSLNATTIALAPLNPAQTGELISSLLDVEQLPPELKKLIIQRSEGVPLYCEEFLRMLLDEGRIVRDGDGWRAVGVLREIVVPPTIQGLLAARLDSLEPAERGALQAASVIGERFQGSELQHLAPELGTEVLGTLVRKGLLAEGRDAEEGLRFRHMLIRDAAYTSLPKAARATHHEGFAALLAAQPGAEQVGRIVAYHAERAFALSRELLLEGPELDNRAREALRWSLVMGEEAIDFRDVEAVRAAEACATAALEVLGPKASTQDRARAQILQAGLSLLAGDFKRARPLLQEAARTAVTAGMSGLAATAYRRLSWIEVVAGDYEQMEAVQAKALELAEAAGDERAAIEIEYHRSLQDWNRGAVQQVIGRLESLLSRAVAAGLPDREGEMLLWLEMANRQLGSRDAARAAADRALAVAQRHALRQLEVQARVRLAQAEDGRDPAEVLGALGELISQAEEVGDSATLIQANRNLAHTLLELGRNKEARPVVHRALELVEAVGERWNRAELMADAGYLAALDGNLDTAERLLDEAAAAIRDIAGAGDPSAEAHRLHRLAQVRALQGRSADADNCFREALAISGRTEFGRNFAPIKVDYARFLAETGRPTDADVVLTDVESWLGSAGVHALDDRLSEVRRLLATTPS